MRVLVVEDEQIIQASFCKILGECALVNKVYTARTGPQMIEHCRQDPLDLIVLDIVIPGFDGLQALAEVRRFLPRCACIVITAHDDFAFAQRAIRLGVIDYLLKPVSKRTLLLSLEHAAEHIRGRAPTRTVPPAKEDRPLIPPACTPPSEGPVADACVYLKEHCTDHGLSLDEVASMVGLSPGHLSRTFKEQTGENFVDYLTRLRLNAAARLLHHTRASIGQIALAVGYADPNYLSRIFHRRTGLTPREYRDGRATKSASPPAKSSRGDNRS